MTLVGGVAHCKDVHDPAGAGEHDFFVVDLFIAIPAEHKPASSAGAIGDFFVATCVLDQPALERLRCLLLDVIPRPNSSLASAAEDLK